MKLLTSCQLVGYNPRKDKSLTIRFETGEKSPEDVMQIHSMMDVYGYLLFSGQDRLTKEEVEKIDNLDTDLYDNPKTQSQRLRNVLYLNWKQEREGHEDFKEYYKSKTDVIIEHFKNKLPDES